MHISHDINYAIDQFCKIVTLNTIKTVWSRVLNDEAKAKLDFDKIWESDLSNTTKRF